MADTPLERRERETRLAVPRAAWRAMARWEAGLAVVLLLGLALRMHGLDWDQPKGATTPLQMHPDERFLSLVVDRIDWPKSIGGYFDTANSPLNPYNDPDTHSYVYGTFPLFLTKGVATMAGNLPDRVGVGSFGLDLPDEHADRAGPGNSYEHDVLWGRRITALFDTATVAIVFALGATLFSRKAGLLGALLYALAVLPTQLAHFWTMDPYVTFFGTATLLIAAQTVRDDRASKRPGVRQVVLFTLLGVCVGLGLASKVTAWPLALAPLLATAIRAGLRDAPGLGLRWRGHRPALRGHWTTDVSILCFSLATAMVIFRIAQPYAFTGPNFWDMSLNPAWRADIEREINFQNGNVDFPPFVQFAGRSPFLTPLKNMVLWGMGPALGITGVVAAVASAALLFRRRELTFLLPLAFAGAVFVFQGARFVAFMRYFAPIYPVICLLAGWALAWLWMNRGRLVAPGWMPVRMRPSQRAVSFGVATAVVIVVAATAWWALAFQSIYVQKHPRIAASEWLYQNVPPGSAITGEIWDDTLPYALPGQPGGMYRIIETEPYATDSLQKTQQLVYGRPEDKGAGGLVNADYVAISSNRVKDSVVRLEREYPATIRYYALLDSGELGFKLVAHFEVRPTLFGLSIDDSSAEESFHVYDHPEVRIYQKTEDFSAERALALLNEAHPERAVNLLPRQGRTNGLQFTAEEAKGQQEGGTFSDVFSADGLASQLPWFWWLLWMELAALASIPWVTWLFRAMPDRGYGLSKLLGLTAVAVPTWALVAWGGPHFSGGLVWTVFGATMAGGVILGSARREALLADFRSRWRLWLVTEAAFLATFAAFLLLRYYNPDLWHHPQGGEKPMEIAYLTAVTRSTIMPPYDPWFAGGSMNYYYMGWFFLAVPIRALRLLPEVAFNLGIPTFAALGASVAFSTSSNLVGLAAKARRVGGEGGIGNWRQPALWAGLLGAFLLIGLANLDGAHQTIERFQAVNTWDAANGVPVLGGAVGVVGGIWQWLFHGATLPPFDWWRSSRVHFGQFDITEFPYWSLLFADLHPHLMGVPFFGLVIAITASYAVSAHAGMRRQPWALAALLGVALGLVRTVHTWEFPAAVLIAGTGVPLGQLLSEGRWQTRSWNAVAHLALAGLVTSILFSPYTARFETFNPGVMRAPETTQANQFFVHYGFFIAVAVVFIAVRYHEVLEERRGDHGRNPFLAAVNGRWEVLALGVFASGLAAFTWPFGLTTLALAGLLIVFLANLLWLELRAPVKEVTRPIATALFLLGFGIAAGVDVVTLNNDIVRMNTVFKFSLQAWQCFALASAFGTWYSLRALFEVRGRLPAARPGMGLAAASATAVLATLFLGSVIFLGPGTAARQERRFAALSPRLDGLAFMERATYVEDFGDENAANDRVIRLADDKPLIGWLRENVEGSPVIVEAVGPLYHWTGRISEYTGLPAVIGWDWHQIQQRTDYTGLVQQRRTDTTRFFRDPSPAYGADYLRKYNVSYIVVGTEEVAWGTAAGLAKIPFIAGVTEVFRSGDYAIYRVDQAQLPASTGLTG
ncbi:MAG: hypothetical protein C0506_15110 [Anaerolinea sp.]|nr:hypothetical protein [Anaerolinea sp.]